jgi:nitrogen regulatory protein P-II 1
VSIAGSKRDGVRETLAEAGVAGIAAAEAKGFGRQKGRAELYRGAESVVGLLPKIKLEVAVIDEQVDTIVEAIMKAAGTGRIGDGKIFVWGLEKGVRIRTGEMDGDARWPVAGGLYERSRAPSRLDERSRSAMLRRTTCGVRYAAKAGGMPMKTRCSRSATRLSGRDADGSWAEVSALQL